MPRDWPVAKKVLQLKGDLSYRELEADIFKKTGQRIPFTNLARLARGEQQGSPRVISILAEYAGKPISWFYETGQPVDAIAEARERYFISTGNVHEDKRRRELYDQFMATGHEMSLRDLEQLIKIAKAIAADDVKYEKKKE